MRHFGDLFDVWTLHAPLTRIGGIRDDFIVITITIQCGLGQIHFCQHDIIFLSLHNILPLCLDKLIESSHQFLHILRRCRGYFHDSRMPCRLAQLCHQLFLLFTDFTDIHLIQNHHLWFLCQQVIVHCQLIVEGFEITNGIFRSTIYNMQQHLTPLNMTQERKAQPSPLRRTLNQSRNITQHQPTALLVHITNTQVWYNRSKWIIGNLGLGRSRTTQQRRLARIGHTQKSHIGNQTQLHAQPPFGTRLTTLHKLGRRTPLRHESGIAPPTPSSHSHNQLLSMITQLSRHLLRMQFTHDGTTWHPHRNIIAMRSILVLTDAILPVFRLDVNLTSQPG
mmetsp:Transcript_24448/g.52703  ORF Transcript_24448/g.52703 Transcript_24448/m.52703 type:complete len:336 (-) Transcript_24448:605-1612(-)